MVVHVPTDDFWTINCITWLVVTINIPYLNESQRHDLINEAQDLPGNAAGPMDWKYWKVGGKLGSVRGVGWPVISISPSRIFWNVSERREKLCQLSYENEDKIGYRHTILKEMNWSLWIRDWIMPEELVMEQKDGLHGIWIVCKTKAVKLEDT